MPCVKNALCSESNTGMRNGWSLRLLNARSLSGTPAQTPVRASGHRLRMHPFRGGFYRSQSRKSVESIQPHLSVCGQAGPRRSLISYINFRHLDRLAT